LPRGASCGAGAHGPGEFVDAGEPAEDKAARRVRTGEEAQRQQDAIRRIGRILSKVKVEADADIVDGEVIVDAELVES